MTTTITTEVEVMVDVIRDFGMWSTDPDLRRNKCRMLVEDGATAADVRRVCEFEERRLNHDLGQVGFRLAHTLRPGIWRESLHAANEHDARSASSLPNADSTPKPEPGAAERAANMNHEYHSRDAEHRLAMAAVSILGNREVESTHACSRRLAEHFGGEAAVYLSRLPALLEQGFMAYQHPCPKLAAHLLMDGAQSVLSAWSGLHEQREKQAANEADPKRADEFAAAVEGVDFFKLRLERGVNAARIKSLTERAHKAERFRVANGWPLATAITTTKEKA